MSAAGWHRPPLCYTEQGHPGLRAVEAGMHACACTYLQTHAPETGFVTGLTPVALASGFQHPLQSCFPFPRLCAQRGTEN